MEKSLFKIAWICLLFFSLLLYKDGKADNNTPLSPGDSSFLITDSWDIEPNEIVTTGFWHDLFSNILDWGKKQLPSMLVITIVFIALLRLLRYATCRMKKIARKRAETSDLEDKYETEKRVETITGIIQSVGEVFLWTIFILNMLWKLNINIAPILASAGLVGVAIGFGAQELVRDFISGFFILLENQIRTGDVAIINDITGTVEKMEMRTITIRDGSGVVHIFQNGKINSLANMTKGWSATIIDIGVSYKENTDRVIRVMQTVGDELLNDVEHGKHKITSFDILGISQFTDNAVVLQAKFITKASLQWDVGREYRKRIKKAFDESNIEMPFPHLSIYAGENTKPIPLEIKGHVNDSLVET